VGQKSVQEVARLLRPEADGGGHRLADEFWFTHGRQLDDSYLNGIAADELSGHLESKASLADPRRAGEGDQSIGPKKVAQLGYLLLAAHEARQAQRVNQRNSAGRPRADVVGGSSGRYGRDLRL
jgi:hypothetical protein